MLTPYIDSVNQPMKDFFEAQGGVEIMRLKSLLVESDVDICRVEPASIIKGAVEVDCNDADALFLSCTALRAAECIARLEAELGKPVLSSNQCMFWQLMKAAGYPRPIHGFGQLLERYL